MANHLERLICQYYEWQGWIAKSNVSVGKLKRGGYAGELDVLVCNAALNEVIHYEPSLDGDDWSYRRQRYLRKFEMGRNHHKEVFPWLSGRVRLRQIAVFNNVPSHRKDFAGGEAMGIDELVGQIKNKVREWDCVGVRAIPENYDLLRTIQLAICGYYSTPKDFLKR